MTEWKTGQKQYPQLDLWLGGIKNRTDQFLDMSTLAEICTIFEGHKKVSMTTTIRLKTMGRLANQVLILPCLCR